MFTASSEVVQNVATGAPVTGAMTYPGAVAIALSRETVAYLRWRAETGVANPYVSCLVEGQLADGSWVALANSGPEYMGGTDIAWRQMNLWVLADYVAVRVTGSCTGVGASCDVRSQLAVDNRNS